MRLVHLLVSLALLALVADTVLGTRHDAKNLHVELHTKWRATPLHLEGSELLAEQGGTLYWDWLRDTKVDSGRVYSDQELYNLVDQYAVSALPASLYQVFKLSMAARTMSPRVEMFRQMASQHFPKPADTPDAFVVLCGVVYRSVVEVKRVLREGSGDCADTETVSSDHVYPLQEGATAAEDVHTVVLYGVVGSPLMREFHETLSPLGHKGEVRYVFRPLDTAITASQPVTLQSYGAELAIKNTEYLVLDDRKQDEAGAGASSGADDDHDDDVDVEVAGFDFPALKEKFPDVTSGLSSFARELADEESEGVATIKQLKAWQMKDLGVQAAQHIMMASDKLRMMLHVGSNFPLVTKSLIKTSVPAALREHMGRLRQRLGVGANLVVLNGRSIELDTFNIFTLLKLIQEDSNFLDTLAAAGVSSADRARLISIRSTTGETRVDMRCDHGEVVYLNDLEKDARYYSWSSDVMELLGPAPNQAGVHFLRKNIFTVIYVLDLSSSDDFRLLLRCIQMIRNRSPVRFGLLLSHTKKENDVNKAIATLTYYLLDKYGAEKVGDFVLAIYENSEMISYYERAPPSMTSVSRAFASLRPGDSFEKAKDMKKYKKMAKRMRKYIDDKGLVSPMMAVNGRVVSGMEKIERAFSTVLGEDQQMISELLRTKALGRHDDIFSHIMDSSGVLPRYNDLIVSGKLLFMPGNVLDIDIPFPFLNDYNDHDSENDFGVDDPAFLRPITHYVKFEPLGLQSRLVAKKALEYMLGDHRRGTRMKLIFSSGPEEYHAMSSDLSSIYVALYVLLKGGFKGVTSLNVLRGVGTFLAAFDDADRITEPAVHDALVGVLKEEYGSSSKEAEELYLNIRAGKDTAGLEAALNAFRSISDKLPDVTDVIPEDENSFGVVVTNGRVLPLLSSFNRDDFTILEEFEYQRSSEVFDIVLPTLRQAQSTAAISTRIAKIAATVGSFYAGSSDSRSNIDFDEFAHDSITFEVAGKSGHHMEAIVDPLSPEAHKIAAFARILHSHLGASVRIHLNPNTDIGSELPLKAYYRYILHGELSFDDKGMLQPGPTCNFNGMPADNTILTLGVHPPEAWMIESVSAPYDLDNIQMAALGAAKTIYAEYQLADIVLHGQCYDSLTSQPASGLELILGTPMEKHVSDTIVMANLGYFQMKTRPGLWHLQLAEGRSQKVYHIPDQDLIRNHADPWSLLRQRGQLAGASRVDHLSVDVSTFDPRTVFLRVTKNKGMEHADLLSVEDEHDSGIAGAISSLLGTKKKTIHVFSVASGHLYERFLSIMMLSVIKSTNHNVKFWFLKNYLSPQFKDFIPYMAAEYGFEYELVTYKWPAWLHKQTVKQRIIWGYKILFLDVLFPLEVDRIIFIDADQVVRGDLMELMDINMKGNTMGYTPFCDSNKDVEGYRFWKQGYWKNHLQGRPYHISALYVVDLKGMRKQRAADQYRMIYDNLSKDPNSLSNLDQDLPNYAQYQVPIFSLPQEWLWCETWCSMESKTKAKTIDLCNNPMTKEPKLDVARRVIGEWTDLDNEAEALRLKFRSMQDSGELLGAEESDPVSLDSGHTAQPPIVDKRPSIVDDDDDRDEL